MSWTLSMVMLGTMKAIDSGITVSFIQKPTCLAFATGWNTNSMPALAGNDVRFMSPYSRFASLSAISTGIVKGPFFVWIVTAPRANTGADCVGTADAAAAGWGKLGAGAAVAVETAAAELAGAAGVDPQAPSSIASSNAEPKRTT